MGLFAIPKNASPNKDVIETIPKASKPYNVPTKIINGRNENSSSAENASIIKFKKLPINTTIIIVNIHVNAVDVE
jgi:hypothetical protein